MERGTVTERTDCSTRSRFENTFDRHSGNIDLINETELDDEQRLYAGYITESSEQIGIYIKALIDISRTIAGISFIWRNLI